MMRWPKRSLILAMRAAARRMAAITGRSDKDGERRPPRGAAAHLQEDPIIAAMNLDEPRP